jgi:hypothetical protein
MVAFHVSCLHASFVQLLVRVGSTWRVGSRNTAKTGLGTLTKARKRVLCVSRPSIEMLRTSYTDRRHPVLSTSTAFWLDSLLHCSSVTQLATRLFTTTTSPFGT